MVKKPLTAQELDEIRADLKIVTDAGEKATTLWVGILDRLVDEVVRGREHKCPTLEDLLEREKYRMVKHVATRLKK